MVNFAEKAPKEYLGGGWKEMFIKDEYRIEMVKSGWNTKTPFSTQVYKDERIIWTSPDQFFGSIYEAIEYSIYRAKRVIGTHFQ